MWGGNDRIIKIKEKVPGKDRWETLDVIPLLPLVGVNHCQSILYVSKIMVHIDSIDYSTINIFSIVLLLTLHFTLTGYSENKLKYS